MWQEVLRLLEDPTIVEAELARRRDAARQADPTRDHLDHLTRQQVRVTTAMDRLVTAYQQDLLTLEDLRTRAQDFEPLSVDRFIAGAMQPAAWYLRAQRYRRIYRDKVNALFKEWDVLITAATPVSAPLIGNEWLEVNGVKHPSRAAMGLLTQPISFAGCPVVAAPMWPEGTGGMPIGVQLIAAPWREDLALRAAMVLQQAGVAQLKAAAL